jgi:hypothetical protein
VLFVCLELYLLFDVLHSGHEIWNMAFLKSMSAKERMRAMHANHESSQDYTIQYEHMKAKYVLSSLYSESWVSNDDRGSYSSQ